MNKNWNQVIDQDRIFFSPRHLVPNGSTENGINFKHTEIKYKIEFFRETKVAYIAIILS